MKIKELKSSSKIIVPVSSVNKVVSPDIKPPIPNKVFTMQVVGTCNSGKSVFVNNLLSNKMMLKKAYHEIILVAPSSSRKCFKAGAYAKIKEENYYNELNGETIEEIYEKIEETKAEGDEAGTPYYSLLIMDDVQASLKDKFVFKKLHHILSSYRHLQTSVVIICQNYLSLLKSSREIIRCLVQFKPQSKKELEYLHDEHFSSYNRHEFNEFIKYVFDKKYNFFLHDREADILTKNLNILKIEKESEDIKI